MKRLFFVGLTFALVALLSNCANTGTTEAQKQAQANLKAEVMAVHDEVMPQLFKLETYRDSLQFILANEDPAALDTAAIQQAIELLNKGINGMNDWMGAFQHKDMEEGTPHDEVMTYFEAEKATITAVKADMLAGLNAAKALLTVENTADELQ